MRKFLNISFVYAMLLVASGVSTVSVHAAERWSADKANGWYKETGWLVGCNFIPSTAINQLEMWQADTFDLETIDRELGWAEDLGFNSVRVFLHHLLWEQDKEGFLKRMEQFLEVADKHKIGVMFVLFDSVWDPHPKLGKQREPKPHLHNSGWVQSPGAEIISKPDRHDELADYARGVIEHFRDDKRVQVWDIINEPDNMNRSSYMKQEPKNKPELSLLLLKKSFAWVREANPSQPITSGVWQGMDWSSDDKMSEVDRFMLHNSDVVSFHDYQPLEKLKVRVEALKRFGRPTLCTEYMARGPGSRFDPALPYLREQNISAYNWGFVNGKSQTIYPWDSWTKQYTAEPDLWFHDIFRADGSVYDAGEVTLIKKVTGVAKKAAAK